MSDREKDQQSPTAEEKAQAAEEAKAKAKAAAAAKAKAQAQKQKETSEGSTSEGSSEGASADGDDEAKKKAAAIAKAKAAAAAKKKRAQSGEKTAEEEKPNEPSVNQPLLDKYVRVITDHFAEDVLEDSYINELAKDVPTLIVKNNHWYDVACFLKHNEQLRFDYLSSVHGIDHETHMEVYYHLYSFKEDHALAVKVKSDRDQPQVASVTPIWAGANWPEREAYDLLGIAFEGHPNLERILLTDDWVGFPLRKDYEQHDEEV